MTSACKLCQFGDDWGAQLLYMLFCILSAHAGQLLWQLWTRGTLVEQVSTRIIEHKRSLFTSQPAPQLLFMLAAAALTLTVME